MTRRTFVAGAIAILLLSAALRLPGLDAQSLWSDEIYSVESARWPLPAVLAARDGHPPLYGLILKALDRLAPSDLHGRIVSAVAGIAAVGTMLALGRTVAGPRAALVAAGLLAISPLHVWYSREGRMYALVTLWSLVSSWCFVRGLRDGARGAWIGWTLASVAGLATHYLYGPVLLAQAVFRAGALGTRRLLPVGGATAALGMVCIALLIALLGDEAAGVVARRRSFEWLSVPYTAFTFVAGFGLGPPVDVLQRDRSVATVAAVWPALAAVAAAGLVLAWAGLRALPSLGTWGVYLVLWLLVPAVSVFGGAWITHGSYAVRYLLPALPPFLLLAGAGIARLPRRWAALVLGSLSVLSALSIAHDRLDPRYAREDLRGAARWLREHAGAGTPVAVSASYVVYGLRHYDDALRLTPLTDRPLLAEADAEEALSGLLTAGGWLVLSRDWEDDPSGGLGRVIARRAPDALVATLPGVRIYRFRPGS